ncbi:CBR4 reductase, partial [Pandion haliaetus]|nr:CBR4 reductase [Pandion haliaetus]
LFLKMGKVCAIFGGSRGIGKAVAELLAQKGCRLAIIARNLEVAQTTARNLGGTYAALQLFLRCPMLRDGLLLRTKTEDMIAQIHTNLLGTMLTCKAAVKSMIQQQGGAIVNIGNIVGLKGNSGQIDFTLEGSRENLLEKFSCRLGNSSNISPLLGFIHTEMTAHLEEDQLKKAILLGRFGEPHEVAQAVVFLLESPYVTGSTLIVDGGLQLL